MTRGDADRRAERPETCPGGSRRKRRGTGRGVSNVAAKRDNSKPEAMQLIEAVVERENMVGSRVAADGAASVSVFFANRRGTEPYARWCGRTAGVTLPPTRSRNASDCAAARKLPGDVTDQQAAPWNVELSNPKQALEILRRLPGDGVDVDISQLGQFFGDNKYFFVCFNG